MDILSAKFVVSAASSAGLPDSDLPEVAFAGRSNVGKSSLINALLGRRNLARTSSDPGKTRHFNFYLVNDAFHLVDLPGLGYARVSKADRAKWARQIASYVLSRGQLRLLVHLVDGRHGLLDADLDLLDLTRGLDVPVLLVLTKADKLSGNERPKAERRVAEALATLGRELPVVLSSAKTGRGRKQVLGWLEMVAESGS
ncbi:MAG: ribosome biogenesis GTP-binding protein YihA/YsxC [Rhodothermales bacterium]|nr:ribosome biogenesis GTP-binding protein YihA/YsxC [Rhodothermales bacterium]